MPHEQMIETHAGPTLAILVTGAGATLAQVVPGAGEFEKWGSQALLCAAVVWLVKQLQDEKKASRDRDVKYQVSLESLVDRSVKALHESQLETQANKIATQHNTAALGKFTESLDVIRHLGDRIQEALSKPPGSHR